MAWGWWAIRRVERACGWRCEAVAGRRLATACWRAAAAAGHGLRRTSGRRSRLVTSSWMRTPGKAAFRTCRGGVVVVGGILQDTLVNTRARGHVTPSSNKVCKAGAELEAAGTLQGEAGGQGRWGAHLARAGVRVAQQQQLVARLSSGMRKRKFHQRASIQAFALLPSWGSASIAPGARSRRLRPLPQRERAHLVEAHVQAARPAEEGGDLEASAVLLHRAQCSARLWVWSSWAARLQGDGGAERGRGDGCWIWPSGTRRLTCDAARAPAAGCALQLAGRAAGSTARALGHVIVGLAGLPLASLHLREPGLAPQGTSRSANAPGEAPRPGRSGGDPEAWQAMPDTA